MQTIGETLGRRAGQLGSETAELPHVGCIGLELELEAPFDFEDVRGWERKGDGSLRGGVEYTFNGAQGGQRALDSILAMGEYLRSNVPEPSFRCSTHIHLDVRDLNFIEYDKLVTLYVLLEHVMFDHCAPERRYSNFCTPFFIADRLIRKYNEVFKRIASAGQKVQMLDAWPKYSALNLKVTRSMGSIEFRGSHALTTSADLLNLSRRMLHLKRIVKTLTNDDETTQQFIMRVSTMTLSELFPTGLNQGYVRNPQDIDDAYSNALFMASRPWQYADGPSPEEREQSFHGITPHPTRSTRIHINRDVLHVYNISVEVLGLDREGRADFVQVLRIWQSLQSIRGMQPPRMSQVFDLVHAINAVGSARILGILQDLGISGSNWN